MLPAALADMRQGLPRLGFRDRARWPFPGRRPQPTATFAKVSCTQWRRRGPAQRAAVIPQPLFDLLALVKPTGHEGASSLRIPGSHLVTQRDNLTVTYGAVG